MRSHREVHGGKRGAWLRAAVLGADDGVVSTASLMIGVASASPTASTASILISGVAGLVAGALSMAAGEFVSVSSQRDAEEADILREKGELQADPVGELEELAAIYRRRGLDAALARKVAEQLSTASGYLTAHLRDELGLDPDSLARPVQAAAVSAASFAALAALPLLALVLSPMSLRIPMIASVSLIALGLLGALGGWLGGAPAFRASVRVILGGGGAMLVTALIGRMLGVIGIG